MQKIENTGPLTIKRMGTIDDEFTDAALTGVDTQAKAGKPFFCYYNSTRMHIFTHLKSESEGKNGSRSRGRWHGGSTTDMSG